MLFECNSTYKFLKTGKEGNKGKRDKIYTEVPEALVTDCCMRKGKRGSQQRRLNISCKNY